jgi:hypothetical protein
MDVGRQLIRFPCRELRGCLGDGCVLVQRINGINEFDIRIISFADFVSFIPKIRCTRYKFEIIFTILDI